MKTWLTKTAYTTLFTLLAAPSALADVGGGAKGVQPSGTPDTLFTTSTTDASGHTVVHQGVFQNIADVLIYIVGAVAVIMLIIGGLRYVISQGDAAAVKQAKDTILYGIIGVVVAILAYAIVSFVTGTLK
jgi:predicted small integral membrane protein